MAITLRSVVELLREHGLLREIIHGDQWTLDPDRLTGVDADAAIPAITYDTREVTAGSLLFIKGRFKPEFLDGIDARGLSMYVAETGYADHTAAPGVIVTNVHQAMSLIAAEFYGRPQEQLTLIGITGTKGKTTTNYFTHAILNAYSGGHAAMMSSIACCLDGETWEPSHLTTPEPLDSFRMMRRAVDAGMRYLVMEVSSQAYKVFRVYGLTFDVAAFLNISPDHISPIEHPTFEDYFFCKRQIIANCRRLVLGADSAYHGLLMEEAVRHNVPVTQFAVRDDNQDDGSVVTSDGSVPPVPSDGSVPSVPSDMSAPSADSVPDVIARPDAAVKTGFTVTVTDQHHHTHDLGLITLDMLGEFNVANAVAAIALAQAAGVPADSPAMKAVEQVQVPGRMERIPGGPNLLVFVDFAHNYMSTKALVDEMVRVYGDRHPRITLVSGTTGGKAIDRREGIVKGALGRAESFIFTLDDPNFEDPQSICEQMAGFVTDPAASVQIITDRESAIAKAIADARAHADRLNLVLVIGKGHETRNIINGRAVAWPGDAVVVRRILAA